MITYSQELPESVHLQSNANLTWNQLRKEIRVRIGPIILLASLLVAAFSLVLPIIGFKRGRGRGMLAGFISLLGVALLWIAFALTFIGVMEGSLPLRSLGFLYVMLIGLCGALLVWFSIGHALRRRFRPGYCSHCGYHAQSLTVCPECGHTVHRPSGSTPQNS